MLKRFTALLMVVVLLSVGVVGVNAQSDTQAALENLAWVQQLNDASEFEVQLGLKMDMMNTGELMEVGNYNVKVKSPVALSTVETIEDVTAIKDQIQGLAKINTFGMTYYAGLKENWVYTSSTEEPTQLYRDDLIEWDNITDVLVDEDKEELKEVEETLSHLGEQFFVYMDADITEEGVIIDVKANQDNLVDYIYNEVKPSIERLNEIDADLEVNDLEIEDLDDEDLDALVADVEDLLASVDTLVLVFSDTGFEVEITILESGESQAFAFYIELVSTENITFDEVEFNETEQYNELDDAA